MKKRRLRKAVGFNKETVYPMRLMARAFFTLLLGLYCTHQHTTAFAQTQKTWTGGSSIDGNWSRRANWNPANSAPLNDGTANLFFGSSSRSISIVNVPWSIRSLTFNSGASSYSILGSMLTVNGGLTNNSTTTQTFSNLIALGASQTWAVGAGGRMTFAGGVTNRGFNLGISGSGEVVFNGNYSGSGGLVKSGSGLLTLNSANAFTGSTTINGGIVSITSDAALGATPTSFSANKLTLNGGRLRTAGTFAINANRGITLGAGGGAIETTTGVLSYGGIITGNGTLTKLGAGTLTLTGANTFSGNTIIQEGTLLLNNTTGSGLGTGNIILSGTGKLGGTGQINGTLTVNSGATINPGSSPGIINSGDQVWNGQGTFIVELKDVLGTEGVGWDKINITGTLTVNTTASSPFKLDLRSLTATDAPGLAVNFDPTERYSWRIIETTGGVLLPGGETEDTIFSLLTGGFANPLNGGTFSLDLLNGGRDLNLIYTPVPEPGAGSVLLMGLGILVLVQSRDRAANWRQS